MDLVAATTQGPLSVRLDMGLDLLMRLRDHGRFVADRQTLASFRWHSGSSTVGHQKVSTEECEQLYMKYLSPWVARAYRPRWPGRLALRLAKRRVDQAAGRAASGLARHGW
jgi:hypothetical protein